MVSTVENLFYGLRRALGFQERTGMVGSTLSFSAKVIIRVIKSVFIHHHV